MLLKYEALTEKIVKLIKTIYTKHWNCLHIIIEIGPQMWFMTYLWLFQWINLFLEFIYNLGVPFQKEEISKSLAIFDWIFGATIRD